jgi:hypothetical protein
LTEYITEHGETINEPETFQRTPLQSARTQLAAFKFDLVRTIAADPVLAKAPCLGVMVVYLDFLTIDERTLRPTTVYASNIKLMARAGIKSKTTASQARKLLVEAGYLVPTGSQTKDGCAKFRVANPRAEMIKMHIREAEEFLAQRDALRKEGERRKKALLTRGVTDIDTPSDAWGTSNWPDRVSDIDTNYLREHLSVSCSREEGRLIEHNQSLDEQSNSYASARGGDDQNEPLPIPRNDHEADGMISMICEGRMVHPAMRNRLRSMLNDGVLTPRMIEGMFSRVKGEAAA